ncbi:T9SS type A sorting domain-containing protein [Flavobacterium amniphilum]|uniref:T9SS type A sorting domain-containing protein n=1 Tax=Flavobacterium amniphilum TaxID=1834035 RepID=UPI00202ABE5C|nr:T9SS type A sorting domain-containing protein [Flavobacterium amniphilum]MCL9804931.1 T9SS type A sorting domain-containing protein [Flavobacterium amniphilum]
MKKIALALFLLCRIMVFSQEAINASGGNASGSNGNVNYSVGQIAYSSYSGNGFVNEGIQFPFEITTLATDEHSDDNQIALFPNPVSYEINLKVGFLIAEDLKFELYDINGRILAEDWISQNEIQIPMGQYPKSIYFLRIKDQNKELKVFKIIKNY